MNDHEVPDWVPVAKGGPSEIRILAQTLENANIPPKVTAVPGG
ncbi:MAG: hypothetical protein P8R38_08340 [Planctomycetota bacterium]|jgi:hypothetical protein|nr:hypothetical protein [Planctomycetota bacterium]MDC0347425.1 hypothetical protein [Planctomycetota bacterium]MDG1456205.1 hypothetical protein [Planctomycetota bacterium]MDG2083819.1 hypothetical protein [Planctomycetota bacterium]